LKVAVVNPPFKSGRFSRTSRSPAINKSGTLYWPFWLAYGVGSLEEAGHEVIFLDCPAENVSTEALTNRIEEFEPAMIVIDTSTPSIHSDLEIASGLGKKLPDSSVILVGTHATALPEACLDSAREVLGIATAEYDHTLVDIAGCLEEDDDLENVPGIVFRRENMIIGTGNRDPIEDLDSLPFLSDVYRRHLNLDNYFFAAARFPSVMTITSRGCPFHCSFCVWPQVLHRGGYR